MPAQNDSVKSVPHSIRLDDRSALILSGIEDVISFDENELILKSSMGLLSVEGEGLHILNMSVASGDLTVEGRVDGFFYLDREKPKQGFFKLRKEH